MTSGKKRSLKEITHKENSLTITIGKKRSLNEINLAENNLNLITPIDNEFTEAREALKEIKTVKEKILSNKKLSSDDMNVLKEIKIYNRDSDISEYEIYPDSLRF